MNTLQNHYFRMSDKGLQACKKEYEKRLDDLKKGTSDIPYDWWKDRNQMALEAVNTEIERRTA